MLEYLLILAALYFVWSLICLECNYRRATSMGIPLVRLPVDSLNIPYTVIEPHLFKFLDLLPPFLLPEFVRYMRRGWFFIDKADSHLRYGPIFACVTPRGIHIQVCDSEAIHDIFTRRLDFVRPTESYKLLEVYGPCISTASLSEWPRHRKVLAAPFNESVMKFVWNESLKQTRQMIVSWTTPENATDGIFSVAKDTRTLSLNVLAAAGFRRSFNFRSSRAGKADTDSTSSYRNVLSTVLDNIIILMLIPHRYLSLPIFPKSLQRIGKAATEYKTHIEQMFEEEMTAFKQGTQGAGGLMTSFVRALNTHEASLEGPKQSWGLSMDDIYGNIFVINFAGHDTTANTLAFSLFLLATEPKVQEWVTEELRAVALDEADWKYGRISAPQRRLQVGDRSILIPANTNTSPSILAVHTHPQHWSNQLEWRPLRWITVNNNHEESLITPPRDTYFPWSDGPQNCPGVKFSQVEFAAVLALLMRNHQLTIVRQSGETEQQARRRVLAVVNDCDMQILLRMRDADRG
ncbi:cytochrome P450 [Cucurbitaria berberidis CBS 394.84]|uniref:Cytochrome P450 n=1 Tax=Cucurbitaria berberidis CBS 394.84 TaxID=1168544 RepID=A0A9P4LCV6_9PLEO|nr:cytochrome P450 [Cucurbitaria berberidis CBS 394.84]KAF1850415.1 cytochrome P450 [Cucurbitaria berberidis CBS 394.84]